MVSIGLDKSGYQVNMLRQGMSCSAREGLNKVNVLKFLASKLLALFGTHME